MKKKGIETAPTRLGLQRSLALSLLAAAILAAGCAPPQPEPTSEWDVSNESNLEPIDHGPWQDILDGYVDDESIVLSSIYKWYPEDFGGTEESVIEHLTQYADGELAEFLEGFGGTIDYEYDWRRETCRARNARGGWRWSTTS